MDGEYKEGWVLNIPADIAAYLREDEIASKVNKAVRERRVWLAAAAELRETEEVKRTGPALNPALCAFPVSSWFHPTCDPVNTAPETLVRSASLLLSP